MIKTHESIARGVPIDHNVVSNLLLGGVINILQQHDTIEDMEKRIEAIEKTNLTDKLRIESLENWSLKQADNLELLSKKISRLEADNSVPQNSEDEDEIEKRMKDL